MRPVTPKTPNKTSTGARTSVSKSTAKKPATPVSKTAPKNAAGARLSKCDRFLHDMEKVNEKKRFHAAVEMGRTACAQGEASSELALLIELSQSNVPYERLLGAMGLCQTHIAKETKRLVKDPFDRISSLAMMSAATHLADSDILELFGELPRRRITRLCERLEQKKRAQLLADAYIATVPKFTRKSSALPLLCWASEDALTKHSTALSLLNRKEWNILVRRCPNFVLTFVEEEMKRNATSRRMDSWVRTLLDAFRRFHPPLGLKLLGTAMEHITVNNRSLEHYMSLFPEDVAALVLKHKVHDVFNGYQLLKKLKPETILALADSGALQCELFFLYVHAPKKVRAYVYKQRKDILMESSGCMHSDVVSVLTDFAERKREAMRALTESEEIRIDVNHWLSYIPLLPFPDALKMAEQHIRDKDVQIRANACGNLVRGGQYHPKCLNDILDFCMKRNKDCDVVRRSIITQLSELPSRRWKEDHYPKLVKIIKSTFDTRDFSRSTLKSCMMLAVKTAPFTHELVDGCLLELCKHNIYIPELDRFCFQKSTLEYIWKSLMPWITEMRDTKKFSMARYQIFNFGSCLRLIQEISLPFVESLCKSHEDAQLECGMIILLRYFRPVAIKLLPDVLKRSLEAINITGVREIVSRHLQGEWLDRYLVPVTMNGFFHTVKDKMLVMFKDGQHWTAAKQDTYAESISRNLAREHLGRYSQREHLAALKKLYSTNVTKALAPYAKEKYEDAFLRDNVITLLGKLQDAASLEILKESLTDERARVAALAIGQRLCNLPTSEIIEALDEPLHSKIVAVRKIAMSLVGDAGDETAYSCLNELRKGGPLHPDMEAAWLRAMFGFLEKQGVWDIFVEDAKRGETAVIMALLSIPDDTLKEEWQHVRLDKLFDLLLSYEDPSVRMKILSRLENNPLPYDKDVVASLFDILKKSSNSPFLIPAVRALSVSSAEVEELASAFAAVRPESCLQSIADGISTLFQSQRRRFESIAVAYIKALLESRCQSSVACQLIAKLPAGKFSTLLGDVLQRGLLHPGAVRKMIEGLKVHAEDANEWDTVEVELRNHKNPFMQRVGLAVLQNMGTTIEWNEGRRSALKLYCEASDVWVSDDAKMLDLPSG